HFIFHPRRLLIGFCLRLYPISEQASDARLTVHHLADYHDLSCTHLNLQNQKPTASAVLSQALAAGVVERAALVQDLALVDITHGFEQHL
ncbi:hypothetical protein QTP70_015283, partial [Hemibagrus guttatus]